MRRERIIRHRRRGWVMLNERKYLKGFQAWNSFISHPDELKGWEARILLDSGVKL